jgi:hypothetical protein
MMVDLTGNRKPFMFILKHGKTTQESLAASLLIQEAECLSINSLAEVTINSLAEITRFLLSEGLEFGLPESLPGPSRGIFRRSERKGSSQ